MAQEIVNCLWSPDKVEEAARFYVSIFPTSSPWPALRMTGKLKKNAQHVIEVRILGAARQRRHGDAL